MTLSAGAVRLRFAPSPTGQLHVGNARTALFNWLHARKLGGTLVLRIEDTDVDRSTVESERAILEDLRWLGLDWDEGPGEGGDRGPYRQSERLGLYREAAEGLLREGRAYYCFCSPAELEEERRRSLAAGASPRYSGRCRAIAAAEAGRRVGEGEEAALRFLVGGGTVRFRDLVRGEVSFDLEQFGDFVILRSTGVPAYNFAVVVDDAAMGITDVVRGEDHISNTPRQILLYRALGVEIPRFGHLPMILGPDQSRLSKRHGAVSVRQYREGGYLPGALMNFLALLGWSPGDDREIMTREELVEAFSLERVSKSSSVFNPEKLDWMNGIYLRSTHAEDLWEEAGRHLAAGGFLPPASLSERKDYLVAVVDLCRNNLRTIGDITDYGPLFFREDPGYAPDVREALSSPEVRPIVATFLELIAGKDSIAPEDFRLVMKTMQQMLKVKGKVLYPTVRMAVSGQRHGPELDRLVSLLGPSLVRRRLAAVLSASFPGKGEAPA